jgi:hypothetical protein
MRLKLGILTGVLAVAILIVGCGAGSSSSSGRGDPRGSAQTPSEDGTEAWGDYRDSLLAWADDRATNASPATAYDEDAYSDLDDSSYRERLERELEDLGRLEELRPPSELAALHQKLVEAFRDFYRADELYQETQAAKNYLAAIKAGIDAQEQLGEVNDALFELVQAVKAAE